MRWHETRVRDQDSRPDPVTIQDLTPSWGERLLHLHDTPRRTAAAFAIGVFFSFSPFIGLQILLSFAIAFLWRLNRLAVFVGLNANLPWLLAPWYAGTTIAAAYALDMTLPADFRVQLEGLFSLNPLTREFWAHLATLVEPFLVPFLVGPTTGAAVIGLVTYPAAHALLRRRARLHAARPSPDVPRTR
jgi:uncharacterized protein (DUF2062 family)